MRTFSCGAFHPSSTWGMRFGQNNYVMGFNHMTSVTPIMSRRARGASFRNKPPTRSGYELLSPNGQVRRMALHDLLQCLRRLREIWVPFRLQQPYAGRSPS